MSDNKLNISKGKRHSIFQTTLIQEEKTLVISFNNADIINFNNLCQNIIFSSILQYLRIFPFIT